MVTKFSRGLFSFFLIWVLASSYVFSQKVAISYEVSLKPKDRIFHVSMRIDGVVDDTLILKMPAWTPGYYQILDYADNVTSFAVESQGKSIDFTKTSKNSWAIYKGVTPIEITYDIKSSRSFVATCYLDEERGYIMPAGVFMYIKDKLQNSCELKIFPPSGWRDIATGLEFDDKRNVYVASDFDVLYDSPILVGNLETLTPFDVGGKTHRFMGYKLGDFDRQLFISDLARIVKVATGVIGDIPYNSYTFIAMGPGQGGIEHLNSTSFGFNGSGLNTPDGRHRMYSFLAHEYFHHYNVKRIRPIELGPFDYDKENKTKMLWVSEGLTVYYDLMIVHWAGLSTTLQLLDAFQGRLTAYENTPGKSFQSATDASYNTWSDGPFGRSDEDSYKTISVYDKGSILGLLLDFKIRHETQNTRSLDDVMRLLYNVYYKEKKRGFTDSEFRSACEEVAGVPLTEFFSYTSTVNPIDYKKYLGYGGLDVDTEPTKLDGAWLGIRARTRNDSLRVISVEYESPAWDAGIRSGNVILKVDDQPVKFLDPILKERKEGDELSLMTIQRGASNSIVVKTKAKVEPSLKITQSAKMDDLQRTIFESWSNVRLK